MDALLILAGLLLFLTALVWLVMRAFDTSLLWGFGSLIPPLTLLFVLTKWPRARTPIFLAGLAAGTVVVGMAQMAAYDADRLSEIFSLRWMQAPEGETDLQIQLLGELNGQKFTPQLAELIDGVLTLREGQDFYASRELIIRLPGKPQGALTLDVLPEDKGTLPEIELNWLLPEQDLPEARRLTRGYSLRMNLQPVAPNKLSGDFHLVLPARFKTSLSGKLELYTDRLRYRNGTLDARYDSRETLSKVIDDYLQRRFMTTDIQVMRLPMPNFSSSRLDIPVLFVLKGVSIQLPLLLEKDPERGWSVSDDHYPPLHKAQDVVDPKPVMVQAEVANEHSQQDRRLGFSLQGLLRDPLQYQNLQLRVQSERGSSAEGRFIGISESGQLIISSQVSGAGEASFTFNPAEVIGIELLEP